MSNQSIKRAVETLLTYKKEFIKVLVDKAINEIFFVKADIQYDF